MYPRWRLISEEDWIQEVFLINIYNMAEHTVRQEEEAVSLSERPLQRAKQGGKTTCWKCFQDASVTNFFAKGAGMIQHFRTMHTQNPLNLRLLPPLSENRKSGQRTAHYMAEVSLLSSPFPSCPARSLFLSPQPPHNTKRPLWRR